MKRIFTILLLFISVAVFGQSPVTPAGPIATQFIRDLSDSSRWIHDVYGYFKLNGGGGGNGVTSFNTRVGAVTLLNADITTALGFTPENLANKAIDFSTVNNTLYPTTQAVSDLFNTLTFSNGLTNSSSNVTLGGTLTSSVNINTNGQSFNILDATGSNGLFINSDTSNAQAGLQASSGDIYNDQASVNLVYVPSIPSLGVYSTIFANNPTTHQQKAISMIAYGTAGTGLGYGINFEDSIDQIGATYKGNYTTAQRLQRLAIPSVNTVIALADSVKATIGGVSVVSVSGTTNRITSTGGTTPVIDISSTFEALLGKVASPLSQFASTTSAQLAGVLSDESGTGVVAYTTNPVFTTPNLGTPSTLVGTNITGTASGLTAGNVTTNANLTGPVTSVGNATSITATTVTPGSYTNTNLTVGADGRITVASNGSGGGLTSSNFVFNETPSGTINGSNVTFTLANTPTSGTVRLYKNGLRLTPTTDYTISGSTITYTSAPSNTGFSDVLLADYLK